MGRKSLQYSDVRIAMTTRSLYLISGGVALALFLTWFALAPRADSLVEYHAQAMVNECRSETGEEKKRCYEREGVSRYGELTVPELFMVIRKIRILDPGYQFCHVLGHRIGELRALEDPERWIDAIPENPTDNMCSNGFIHGVIIGRFRDDVVTDEEFKADLSSFVEACAPREGWRPSPLDRAICYHGMGHLFAFITELKVPRALSMCRSIAVGEAQQYLRVCQEGVFMQIYQPLEPDDYELLTHLTHPPTKQTYRSFCSQYKKDDEEAACLREAVAYFRNDLREGKGVDAFCAGHPKGYTEDCYETALTIIGRTQLGNTGAVVQACSRVSESRRGGCLGRAALAVLEEASGDVQMALSTCLAAPPPYDRACLDFLGSRAQFIFPDNSGVGAFCSAIRAQGGRCDSYTQ